jgi:hypothetical protein
VEFMPVTDELLLGEIKELDHAGNFSLGSSLSKKRGRH